MKNIYLRILIKWISLFDFYVILHKAAPPELENENVSLFFVSGLSLGLVLSLLIIFFKKILKKNINLK